MYICINKNFKNGNMEAKELRIGNFLKGYNGRIFEWDYSDIELCSKGVEVDEIGFYIPINQDWVLKLGFEKHNRNDFYTKHAGLGVMSIYIFDNFSRIKIVNQSICKIKYIHQLQNLFFALTGEELLITKP